MNGKVVLYFKLLTAKSFPSLPFTLLLFAMEGLGPLSWLLFLLLSPLFCSAEASPPIHTIHQRPSPAKGWLEQQHLDRLPHHADDQTPDNALPAYKDVE